MKPILFFLTAFLFIACNNNDHSAAGTTMQSTTNAAAAAPDWEQEDEVEFMGNCVEGAKARYKNDEKRAYAYCNCVLNQIKDRYPNMDSAQAMLRDTAQVMKLQEVCK